jgi:hypothetical protein
MHAFAAISAALVQFLRLIRSELLFQIEGNRILQQAIKALERQILLDIS